MTEPIKISEQGRALTCDEYDNNLDILRDRSNHTGTQSCNTLNDLDSCLSTSNTINTINGSINTVTTRVINLENTLSASGSIANDLNSLEASLTADITENRSSITTLETDLDALEVRVSGAESNLVSLTSVVTLNNNTINTNLNAVVNTNNAQDTRLTNVENRATTLAANILTEAGIRQSAVNNLQSEIDAEEINRINGDINLTTALDNEEALRISADNDLDNRLTLLTTESRNDDIVERTDRIAGDANLQAQLNTLTSSISSAIPTATILLYAGNFTSLPTGFLMCTGGAISRTTFATLFSRIGTRYGVGNGTTTFNLPDFRDKIAYCSSLGNLDSTPTTVGSNQTVLTINNLPSHNHSVIVPSHDHTVNIQHQHGLNIHPHNHTTGSTGSHTHSLAPYRQYAEGNGDRGNGAELTAVAGGSNIYPNVQSSTAPGPVVNSTTVSIWPVPYPGYNATNFMIPGQENKTTSSNGSATLTTAYTGNNTAVDMRQNSIQVNYIIKT